MRSGIIGMCTLSALVITSCQNDGPTSPPTSITFDAAVAVDFAATLDLTAPPLDPGSITFSDGVLHLRGQVNEGPLSGDLSGVGRTVIDIDTKGTHLTGRGTFVFLTPDGTWEGRFEGKGDGPVFAGHLQGSGIDGAVAGMKFNGTFTDAAVNDVFDIVGRMLDPRP